MSKYSEAECCARNTLMMSQVQCSVGKSRFNEQVDVQEQVTETCEGSMSQFQILENVRRNLQCTSLMWLTKLVNFK